MLPLFALCTILLIFLCTCNPIALLLFSSLVCEVLCEVLYELIYCIVTTFVDILFFFLLFNATLYIMIMNGANYNIHIQAVVNLCMFLIFVIFIRRWCELCHRLTNKIVGKH